MSKIISTKEQTENKGTIKICQSLRKVCAALALMLLCGLSGWGQDFSGYYYIVNHDNYYAARWYLVPAKDPRPRTHYADSYFNAQYRSEDIEPDNPDYTGTNYGDLQKPFLTTHHNDLDTELLIWQIVASSETGYYHIIHNKTGKYVKYEYPYRQAKDRKSMHLETTDNPDDDAFKFVITGSMDGNINIRPKSVGSGNRFWNVSGENQDEYHATTGDYLDTGMVGLSNDPTDDKAIWHFVVLPPVVTYDYTTQEVAITDIDPDATIYYTLDGTYPTTSSTLYEAPFEQTESCTVKAIAVRHGISSETTTFELEQVATPSIAVNNNAIAITCATTGASIYYNVGDTPETTTDPTPSSSHYTSPLTSNVSNKCIKAIAVKDGMIISDVQQATLQLKCNKPSISCNGTNFTITHGDFPSGVTVTVYYTYGDNPEDPTTSSEHFTTTSATVSIPHTPYTVKAIAVATDYLDSDIRTVTIGGNLGGSGTESDPYLIASDAAFIRFTLMADTEEGSSKWYKLTANVSASGSSTITHSFSGVLEGKADANGVFHTISDLEEPIFSVIDGGFVTEGVDFVTNQSMVRNIILKDVNISGHSGNTGAIACRMIGNACIYNCGILSGSVGGTGDTGGILGSLERYEYNTNSPKYSFARVVNCFSFANITSAGEFAAGIVGNNAYGPKTDNFHQTNSAFRTAVVNCMFYGDILGGTKKAPVYGNKTIANNSATAINNYNYFLAEAATFNEGFNADAYKNSWPAKEEDLTRFEYYRSILNSNRPLITWYVTNKKGDEQAQSDRDLIAKWVLDPEIAPYPILKKWDKYFSVINPDPDNVWDEESREWKSRDAAADYQGKKLGTLSVTIMTGDHPGEAGMTGISVINDKSWTLNITDMDTLNHDYCYYKVQLPYYNEVFGDKTKTDFIERYYGNYTDKVVTGWKIVSVNDGDEGESYTFNSNWESGCNFADRTDKYKDLYAKSGRVFAQGGYYYVPEDVTAITIEAYWGKAVYLHNKEHYVDRVYEAGSTFAPAGILPDKFPDPTNGYSVYDDIKTAISSLDLEGSGATAKTVYDQAIVLVGNYQFKNKADQSNLGWNNGSGSTSFSTNLHPFTMTSVDLDFDNEPDCCLELQYGEKSTRVNIHPVRFDFLPIPSLGMAMRTSSVPQSCGIFILRGHFEITETAYMHFGQFEYDTRNDYRKELAPVIINGGRIDQIVSSERFNLNTRLEKTSYFILGGHLKMKTFSPGCHGDGREGYDHHVPFKTRHCAVNVIGGQFGDFYLSGMFNKNVEPVPDNPHCYSNGGKFNLVAGAGQEKINCDKVTFRMDHSIIGEFYGGGINGEFSPAQITGNIDVVVDNSIVGKFCGGPKTGDMADGTNVTTEANGTTFGMFYGAGNGGTNYRRVEINDNNGDTGAPTPSVWNSTFEFGDFAPFINKAPDGQYAKYTSQYEFELMNVSSGSNNNVTARSYRWEAEFTATKVMQATSTLNNCTVLQDFYGGGNLGPVMGDVTSTLFNTKIYGSAYGGGYSGAIPTIRVHDVSTVKYPYRDGAGVCHDGSLDFVKDGNTIREYQWTNEKPSGIGSNTSGGEHPDFQDGGKWYCYTDAPLTDLGIVHGNTILNVNGSTKIYGSSTLVNGEPQAPYDGAAYGGGNMADVWGNSTVNVNGSDGEDGLLVSNVFGGGNFATTGRSDSESINYSKVVLYGGTIGVVDEGTQYHYDNSGSVYGGGKGTIDGIKPDHSNILEIINEGRVYGNSQVEIRGGKVLNNVFGGGQYASVGSVDANGDPIMANGDYRDGSVTVTVLGGEVGPLDMTGLNAYVYGGGEGVPDDLDDNYVNFANANNTVVTVNMPMDDAEHNRVWGSLFGGSADGHVLGDAEVNLVSGTIGTDGTTSWDGNIFGGGRNYTYANITAGRVGGNITVNMSGGLIKGSVFGGGRMGNTGVDVDGVMQEDENSKTYGHVNVNVSGGTVGTSTHAQTIGNVFGGGKGHFFDEDLLVDVLNWAELGLVKMTHVNIYGNARIHGSVYGGGEIARVEDSTFVEVKGGIIGTAYGTQGQTDYQHFGSVYGGGQGYRREEPVNFYGYDYYVDLGSQSTGRVGKNTRVEMSGGQVMENVYGGGRIASVGPIEMDYGIYSYNAPPVPLMDENGNYVDGRATVIITGGQVGPLDMTGLNGYVYGGSKGRDSDPDSQYTDFSNVNNASVSMSGGNVWGSLFGGCADGHVLGDAEVNLSGGTVGTNGTTSWDGNIFGGGRNYKHTNKTAGRVGGNITVNMSGGQLKGNIYGGGRLGNTGFNVNGVMQEDEEGTNGKTYGHIKVNVTGGTIGYDYGYNLSNYLPSRYVDTIGCVVGGGKGITFEVTKNPETNSNDTTYIANWDDFANSKTTEVNIGGSAKLWGNVYGGSEQSLVRDSVNVTIGGNAEVHLKAFAGGRGFLVNANANYKHCGDVGGHANGSLSGHGLARITLKDKAKVNVCLYGGAKLASVHGNAYVNLLGGTVGRNRSMEQIVGTTTTEGTEAQCHVFGSSQGTNKHGNFNTWSNVDTVYLTSRPGVRVFGSIYGGGDNGHVLGDVHLDIKMGAGDRIGTFGYSDHEGYVFGGGRGYNPKAYTVGGVGGNIYTHIYSDDDIEENERPTILATVFGGGHYASTGILFSAGDDAGTPIEDDPEHNLYYGHTQVIVEGKVDIGHDPVGENLAGWIGGNVYGGGMGSDADENNPTEMGARMGFVKQTDVIIRGDALVKGTVNGGGECGRVLKDTKVTIDENCTIGLDRGDPEHPMTQQELDDLRYSGNVVAGGWGSYDFDYVNVGRVEGNTKIIIQGGKIKNNVYGGGEHASIGTLNPIIDPGTNTVTGYTPQDNTGHATIIMKGGELGPLDMSGTNAYIFGGGQGLGNDPNNLKKHFGEVFTTEVIVKDSIKEGSTFSSPLIYGSIFGGGQDGHVLDTAYVEFNGGTIGTNGTTSWDGNIFGGGRNYMGLHPATGRVGATVRINMTGGLMKGNIYGGGRLGSVGVDDNGVMQADANGKKYGYININVTGGTVGNTNQWEQDHTTSGNVYGGGMGRLTLLSNTTPLPTNPIWPSLAKAKQTDIKISQKDNDTPTVINNSVYGGGELGTVEKDATITVESGSIMRDIFGGGFGSDKITDKGNIGTTAAPVWITPLQYAGRVGGNTSIGISGGWVRKSVYGGGEFASVGHITDSVKHVNAEDYVSTNPVNVIHHFPYSWPYQFNYETGTGTATINITGGRIGITGSDYMGPKDEQGNPIDPVTGELLTEEEIDDAEIDNGDVYGGGMGFVTDRYLESHCANVYTTDITINYTDESATPTNYKKDLTKPCIAGALYGGGENGHVYTDANIDFKKGLVGHNIYGGGKGKDKYLVHLLHPQTHDPIDRNTYSLTAGKVYGNTHVTIEGGYVVRSVFGGGNLASVGKGNYAGGYGDYSQTGYGEVAANMTQWADTTNSGHTYVTITGGQLGYLNTKDPDKVVKDSIPYGTVFGGCRGKAVPNADSQLTPRIKYYPEHYVGYVNHTHVTIGTKDSETGPRIYASVYGGAQDGHVRWNTRTNINSGEIGVNFGQDVVAEDPVINNDPESFYWISRGNVYGGGAGASLNDENQYCNIAGSVTHKVWVNINGGMVHRNVYGGGNLATVGPPRIWQDHDCDSVHSCTRVNINTEIGRNAVAGYGGNVYGGSRGWWDGKHDFSKFAFCPYAVVNINANALVPGSVYGGGNLGPIGQSNANVESKHDTWVNLNAGRVKGNVFGGGKGLVIDGTELGDESYIALVMGSTHVKAQGTTVEGNIYGGGDNGRVFSNTHVDIEVGEIGLGEDDDPEAETGNVYGGGRGLGQYSANNAMHYSAFAGRVNGNTLTTITGGHINGNVFGGGELASVGLRNIGANNDPNPNTGWARVKISGGTIGTNTNISNTHGNVFGASRGVAGDEYQDFAYVNNTLVTLSSPTGSSDAPIVKGSIYGSGDDGHVLLNTQVTINSTGGTVGVEGVSNTEKGNVFGGGRGTNTDANGQFSPTAGLVKGHTKVNISNGHVHGDVFGGGQRSNVRNYKLVNIYGTGEVHGSVYGGSKAVPANIAAQGLNKGLKTVNVRGGSCHIYGNVYGCSQNSVDGDPAHPTDRTAFINIDGGTIGGNVYGAGWTGEVKGSVSVGIGANAFAYTNAQGKVVSRDEQNVLFDNSGGIPIVVIGNVRDIHLNPDTLVFTAFLVDEGAPAGDRKRGFCWKTSAHPTISDAHVEETFGQGDVGNFSLAVNSEIVGGTHYYVRAYAKNGRGITYSPEMEFTMTTDGKLVYTGYESEEIVPPYPPVPAKLTIGGSVYGGSNHIGSDPNASYWNTYDISGFSYILIDGSGYNTTAATAGKESKDSPYMNIGGGLFGSGTHCESGAMGREIFLKDYGTRNAGEEFTKATRTLTTIQRCDYALLANSNVNLSGSRDISSSHDQRNYAVMKVDKGFYMAEASALNLGAKDLPAYMDSIRMMRSVRVSGDVTYNDPVTFWNQTMTNPATWDWVGLKDYEEPVPALGTDLYRITSTGPSAQPLTKAEENVIIFNDDSRLWVRYHERKEGDAEVKQYYGELNGFFRMKSPFEPYGTKSFAYARPKLTQKNGSYTAAEEKNTGDGGFLSYETRKNFHTQLSDGLPFEGDDGGTAYTQTKQYPYTNVIAMSSKGENIDLTDYREWVIVKPLGKKWYVDGTRGWGKDLMKPADGETGSDYYWKYNWGRYPDKPKLTVSGPQGIFAGTYSGPDTKVDFHYKDNIVYLPSGEIDTENTYYKDAVYVVGPLDGVLESNGGNIQSQIFGSTEGNTAVNIFPEHTLILLRYPGHHELSISPEGENIPETSKIYDEAESVFHEVGVGYDKATTYPIQANPDNYHGLAATTNSTSTDGPGANYGAMMNVQDKEIVLNNVYMDGLYGSGSHDFAANPINYDVFHPEDVVRPLVVTANESNLTMKGGTMLKGGCNNIDGAVWYDNSDYDGNGLHGGAVYVDAGATVNVEGRVSITGNLQKNGSAFVESNVYLPTFAKHINITNDLTGSSIGITSPIRNKESNYIYNTFSPIAVADMQSGNTGGIIKVKNIDIVKVGELGYPIQPDMGEPQYLPYQQSFASGFGSYITRNVLGEQEWSINNGAATMGGFGNTNEDWLISSPVNLTGITDSEEVNMTLEYNGRNFTAINLIVTVWASLDYVWEADPTTATWTRLPAVLEASEDDVYKTVDVDLASYKGHNVTIAVKYAFNPTISPNILVAESAWANNNLYDDLDWFFYKGGPNSENRTTYYSDTIADYPGCILESEASSPYIIPDKTLFFGWTWANIVRKSPDATTENPNYFNHSDINTPQDLAWVISEVNGLNGQTGGHNLEGTTITQTADFDLQQYVWVPIGANMPGAMPFSGQYEGRGHLITNMDIDYIGSNDCRYNYTDFGLFGYVVSNAQYDNQGEINRTFVVSGLIRPEGTANMGGLVGKMQGANAMVSNSEAAVHIVCPNLSGEVGAGGLVGKMQGGTIHSSMAMPHIDFDHYYATGGLVGYAENHTYQIVNEITVEDFGGSGGTTKTKVPEIMNSFANAKFTIEDGDHTTHGAGGLVGNGKNVKLWNCYSHLYDNNLNLSKFKLLVANKEDAEIRNCYGFDSGYDYCEPNNDGLVGCGKYTPVISADELGYMCADNKLENDTSLFLRLNRNAWAVNKAKGDSIYAHWARPALAEINGDLPVLLLDEGTNYKGDFRSVGTYAKDLTLPNGGPALQYGGPVRDGEGNTPDYRYLGGNPNNEEGGNPELDGALDRESANDYLFIYGDIVDAPTQAVKAAKVSIYEHAAIKHSGTLANYDNTYVGITFDNSCGHALSTFGVNHLAEQFLPRDWHMFSTPLQNAPLGFNYLVNGVNTNEKPYSGGDGGEEGKYYNNPWPFLHSQTENNTEFIWLNDWVTGDNRYWMKNFDESIQSTDGYFPSQRGALFSDPTDGTKPLEGEINELFIVGSDECPTAASNRYPYGMDLYCWYEPEPHWINFKRNGPNHWHSDEYDTENQLHAHLNYTENGEPNKNEDNLVVGKGYMASIAVKSFLQSHGRLNESAQRVITNQGSELKGWNLVGNPYHGYLDFDALGNYSTNSTLLSKEEGVPFYVIYDADQFTGNAETAYRYYPMTGSPNGDYAGRYLHPHQGFYVKAANSGNLVFNEAMTKTRDVLTDNADGHFRSRHIIDDNRPAYPLVNLYLSSHNGCADVTVIEFERPEWSGALKMKELRQGNGLFYAQHGNTHYAALFTEKGAERVPLWFEAKEDDIFTIRWNTANGDFLSMYLIDNLTGVTYDMLANESYTFQGHVGDYPSRFYIVFKLYEDPEEPEEPEESEGDGHSFVFFDGSEWVVTGDGMLDFIDVQGRILSRNRLTGGQSRVSMPPVAAGVYMFRLTNGEETKVQKVIVTNY